MSLFALLSMKQSKHDHVALHLLPQTLFMFSSLCICLQINYEQTKPAKLFEYKYTVLDQLQIGALCFDLFYNTISLRIPNLL